MEKRKLVLFDIETYSNYMLFAFKGLLSGKVVTIEARGGSLNRAQQQHILNILATTTIITFNGIKFDLPLTTYALSGATCKQIHTEVQKIIGNNQPAWMTYKNLELDALPRVDHIDLCEVAPAVMISLKNYGTRLGTRKLQDLPYEPSTVLTDTEMDNVRDYCGNDLVVTGELYYSILHEIELREGMSNEYGVDLRSKSGAQVAEIVLLKETKYTGARPDVPKYVQYTPTSNIVFKTPQLQQLLTRLKSERINVKATNGSPELPKWLRDEKIAIGNTVYQVGLGGIHDTNKTTVKECSDTHCIIDIDVASYYPSMIIEYGFAPKHIGKKFSYVYTNIYKRRMLAKRSGDKATSNSLKLVLNSAFGKMGSKYSKLYSPDLMLQVTLTGQLLLLMLIEDLEAAGIEVFYANTDGITVYLPRTKQGLMQAIVFDWELLTGMMMEEVEYRSCYIRDVNNFVNITASGTVKSKGIYAETTLSKGRSTPIVYEAVRKYLLDGTLTATTIKGCKDMHQFVSARTVKGGGVYDGEYLGKMVRWYYSKSSKGFISYKLNGNKVPKTDGAKPMMDMQELVAVLPDIDYEWYLEEAVTAFKNLGIYYVV